MNSRIHWMKALSVVIVLWGAAGSARAAQAPQGATLSLEKVKLSQAIRLLTVQDPNAQIVFVDPKGVLADRYIPFVQIQAKSVEDALKQLCRSIGVYCYKDADGILVVSETPKPAPEPAAPAAGDHGASAEAQVPELPEPLQTDKINVQFTDGLELIRLLSNSSSPKTRDQLRQAKTLDDIDLVPGTIDPTTGNWYYPGLGAPIYGGASAGLPNEGASPTAGHQGFGGGGFGGGQFGGGGFGGGGFGGGGLGGGGFGGGGRGGFGGGGLGGFGGGGLGGGGFGGGGLGGGGFGGGGLGGGGGLVPPGLVILGYPLDNSLIVRGTPTDIAELRRLIALLDVPPKQLNIKIEQIAVTTQVQENLDIAWQIVNNDTFVESPTPFPAATTGTIGAGIVGGNWRAQISAGLTNSTATIIDSLNISTMNNVPASIQTTSVTYVFIPNIQIAGGGSGQLTTFTPVPVTTPTILTATPRINGDGSITMFIPFIISQIVGTSTAPDGTSIPNQIFSVLFALRRVMSGQTIVVGGTFTENNSHAASRVPGLSTLPLVGGIFRPHRLDNRTQTETLYFFTPTILPDPVEEATGNATPAIPGAGSGPPPRIPGGATGTGR